MPRQATRASRAILITRPQPGAAESAQALRALGWEPVLAPALTLTALPFKAPPHCQALVITSRAAARALPALPLRVIAVGDATAAEARARGFADVQAAAGDAAAEEGAWEGRAPMRQRQRRDKRKPERRSAVRCANQSRFAGSARSGVSMLSGVIM